MSTNDATVSEIAAVSADATDTADVPVKPPLSPAMARVGKSLASVLNAITAAANVGAPDLSVYDAKLAVLEAFRDDPTFARAIADIDVARENAIREHNRTAKLAVIAEIRETFGAEFAALNALIAPPVPVSATPKLGRPTNAAKSERTVARTADDLRANPHSEYIGAPLADIAALGHTCNITSILTNGAKRSAHVKQQIANVVELPDPASHAACIALAKQTVTLYGTRLQLRDAN